MRVPFSAIFNIKGNGTVTPRTPIEFNGAELSTDESLSEDASVGGTNLGTLKGHDLEVSESNGFISINGHY